MSPPAERRHMFTEVKDEKQEIQGFFFPSQRMLSDTLMLKWEEANACNVKKKPIFCSVCNKSSLTLGSHCTHTGLSYSLCSAL